MKTSHVFQVLAILATAWVLLVTFASYIAFSALPTWAGVSIILAAGAATGYIAGCAVCDIVDREE